MNHAPVDPALLRAALVDTEMTVYEKTTLLGIRARQLENGAEPLVPIPEGIFDPLQIAGEELVRQVIPLRIQRFYHLVGGRFVQTFDVSELHDPGYSRGQLRVVDASATRDLAGGPAEYRHLRDDEISHVLDLVLVGESPAPRGAGGVAETHFIRTSFGATREIQEMTARVLRAFLVEELRRTPFPTDTLSLHRLAAHIGCTHNGALMTPLSMVGYRLAEAVVETQAVISAFHAPGKKLTALKALATTAMLVKGKSTQHSDFLAFRQGYMTPFRAIHYNQLYTDVKIADLLRADVAVVETRAVAESVAHLGRLRLLGMTVADVGPTLLRLEFDPIKLVWHRVALVSLVRRLRKAIAEFHEATTVVVVGPPTEAYVDILLPLGAHHGVHLKTIETHVVSRVLKWSATEGVRGILAYAPEIKTVTSFVLNGLTLERGGGRTVYLWQINRQELEIQLDVNPLPVLLAAVDPDASFEWMPTGVPGEEYSHQARVVVHDAALASTAAVIEAHRIRNRDAYVRLLTIDDLAGASEASARVLARQLEYAHTAIGIINALGEELVMKLDIAVQGRLVHLARPPHTFERNLELLRTVHAMDTDGLDAHETHFLANYRAVTLLSDGSNYLDNLRLLPHVDSARSYPTNPRDTYLHLGTEAARLQLLRLFIHHFSKKGKQADPRHLELISDVMMQTGALLNLADLSSGDVGGSVLRATMRGRATAVLRNAGIRDAKDEIPGVLTSHVTGTRVAGGTGGVGIVAK